ncbi:uncharacterized protein LAESUDRAFT_795784 [Laetiporus sulphureus 93-53]|uniref:Uncharacterized protein n=1 Tax=Laetiporus sulphureus 93-53 TaxID=1314785 RepID=A0A165BSV2_9APHY|nr:uncharacterized protein LAESUDRAFT_795784 [Laetiporus sulphureus 93-53]KZT01586.1 hypothetical protein LAESUDRAFT_795784 [Laetiporus sulphureus 93-53]
MFFTPFMLNVIVQHLMSQAAESAGIVGNGVHDEELVAQALKAFSKAPSEDMLLQLSGGLNSLLGEMSSTTFSSPICDLVLVIFGLNKNNWLKLRETFNVYVDEPHLMSYINLFRTYWFLCGDQMAWGKASIKPFSTVLQPKDEKN